MAETFFCSFRPGVNQQGDQPIDAHVLVFLNVVGFNSTGGNDDLEVIPITTFCRQRGFQSGDCLPRIFGVQAKAKPSVTIFSAASHCCRTESADNQWDVRALDRFGVETHVLELTMLAFVYGFGLELHSITTVDEAFLR